MGQFRIQFGRVLQMRQTFTRQLAPAHGFGGRHRGRGFAVPRDLIQDYLDRCETPFGGMLGGPHGQPEKEFIRALVERCDHELDYGAAVPRSPPANSRRWVDGGRLSPEVQMKQPVHNRLIAPNNRT